MNDKLIVEFKKSNDGLPVLVISRADSWGFLGGSSIPSIIQIYTGKEAVRIWNELNGEVIINVEENK